MKNSVKISLFLFCVVFNTSCLVEAAAVSITHLQGKVRVEAKGSSAMSAKLGQKLKPGDVVITGSDSLAILEFNKETTIKINSDSRMVVSETEKVREIKIEEGSVFAKLDVKKKKKRRFRLRTRSTTMGVRGTQFFAAFAKNKSKDLWMCVNEGEVRLESLTQKKAVMVRAGEGVHLPKGTDLTKPKPYEWTKKLNWNMDPEAGDVVNQASVASFYDRLGHDYD